MYAEPELPCRSEEELEVVRYIVPAHLWQLVAARGQARWFAEEVDSESV